MKIEVLDKGYVILQDHYGDDLSIVNAARQSFAETSEEITKREVGLINFLMKNHHGTPFEMVDFNFNIKCPLTVAREWMRHRISSFNEMSGRYKKLPKEFYIPSVKDMRTQVGKPGSYKFKPLEETVAKVSISKIEAVYEVCWETYEELLELGVAKEVARSVLPVGLYTQFTFKTNLRSLFNFLRLRNEENAMFEIRQYAIAIEEIIKDIVPVSYTAFVKHGRMVP